MNKRRISIDKLWPGFKIKMAGGAIMTVTAKPVKQPDGRWMVPNDFNGQILGDPHLTFPNIDANTTETETKLAESE